MLLMHPHLGDTREVSLPYLAKPWFAGLRLSLIALAVGWVGPKAASTEPTIVTRPAMDSPLTTFDDKELQAKYAEAWRGYQQAVEAASAALATEFMAQADAARGEGNLDLLKFWTEIGEQWRQTGEFAWDADEERRTWARFMPSKFPSSMTLLTKKTADQYVAAIEQLGSEYRNLEKSLVQQGADEAAAVLRKEIASLLDANNFTNVIAQSSPREGRTEITQVRDRFVGEWVTPAWKYAYVLAARPRSRNQGSIARRQADGRVTDTGSWMVDKDGHAQIRWEQGGAKGWVEFITVLPEGLMAGNSRDPKGVLRHDGWVVWPKEFDWRGVNCHDVLGDRGDQPAAVGEWTHPNGGLVYEIAGSGEFVERKKAGGLNARGTWQRKSDGSYGCQLSNGWRLRFWAHGDVLVVLPFSPKQDLAGDGVYCERIK